MISLDRNLPKPESNDRVHLVRELGVSPDLRSARIVVYLVSRPLNSPNIDEFSLNHRGLDQNVSLERRSRDFSYAKAAHKCFENRHKFPKRCTGFRNSFESMAASIEVQFAQH